MRKCIWPGFLLCVLLILPEGRWARGSQYEEDITRLQIEIDQLELKIADDEKLLRQTTADMEALSYQPYKTNEMNAELMEKFSRFRENYVICQKVLRHTRPKSTTLLPNCMKLTNHNGNYTISHTSSAEGNMKWTLIQRSVAEGKKTTWTDIREGYGSPANVSNSYLIGLNKFYEMVLGVSHNLLIYFELNTSACGFGYYNRFTMGGKEDNYRLTDLSSYMGTLRNRLKECQWGKERFTSYDEGDSLQAGDPSPWSSCVQRELAATVANSTDVKLFLLLIRPKMRI